MDILSLARKHLKNLKPYSSARHEYSGKAAVYLDANESPFPSGYNRYPDPFQSELKKCIGQIRNVDPENIFIGNGSDEPIDLLIRIFCEPGRDNILIPDPSYGMYQVSAAVNNIEARKIRLDHNFQPVHSEFLKSADQHSKILFLCSPNNPTGNAFDRERVTMLIENFKGLVVIDEAYIDFCPDKSFVGDLLKYENLLILQTLSKAFGLAGLRLGLCMAAKPVVTLLNQVKPPYNISSAAQEIALTQLKECSTKKNTAVIVEQRLRVAEFLKENGLKAYPSDANFLLVQFPNPSLAYRQLLEDGIVVRDRSAEAGCEGCLRITIGTPAENDLLMNSIEKIFNL
ncbi:MAG: histidinol-phosphate transaminase [Bacteroidetes bacterium]|nr:histidinol-phosphate transaminase [Bacteroidota bacterium]